MFYFSHALYVILDAEVIAEKNLDIFNFADRLALYGADIFQLRAKNMFDREFLFAAKKLTGIIRRRKKIFIVNDRVDIAYLSGASGVHLGKKDVSVKDARKILGINKIIGKTTHSLKEWDVFKKERPDYFGVGPVFRTKTKPALPPLKKQELQAMISKIKKPVFAIGGIDLDNVNELTALGIGNIAVCRSIIFSRDYKSTIERFKRCLKKVS